MTNKVKLESPIIIKIAKSALFLSAHEKGEISAQNEVQGVVNTILLKNVLIIDDLSYNLLSVSRLDVNGFVIIFTNGRCLIAKKWSDHC